MPDKNLTEEPKKPEKKTKADLLAERVEKLELCLAKVCHYTGNERALDEFGIERWTPGKNDMRKFKD